MVSRPMAIQHPDPLDAAVWSLVDALAAGAPDGVDRALRALSWALCALNGMLAGLGVRGADLADVRQDLLKRLYDELCLGTEVDSPRGWVRRIAYNLAIDLLRRRGRHATPVPPELIVEKGGVYWLEDLFAKEREEREGEARRVKFRAWVAAYFEAADALAPPRGHHVRAWFARRVEGRSAVEIGHMLATRDEAPTPDLVSKWVQRGAALVRMLSATDDDAERAAAMRRASAC